MDTRIAFVSLVLVISNTWAASTSKSCTTSTYTVISDQGQVVRVTSASCNQDNVDFNLKLVDAASAIAVFPPEIINNPSYNTRPINLNYYGSVANASNKPSNVVNFNDMRYLEKNADTLDWSKHPCKRSCAPFEPPRRCLYVFVVEELSSMSKACYDCPFNLTDCYRPHCMPTDGDQKKLFVVNRQIPGPIIEVCQHDQIVVQVENKMKSQSTSVHWHGIAQEDTPYMDGVPFVTQCPIHPGDSFRYIFKVRQAGTFFWHSHTGGQRSDGFAGALIVNTAARHNNHSSLYDRDEHRMVVADWARLDGDSAVSRELHYKADRVPETLLVNGRGRFKPFTRQNRTYYTPVSIFQVQRGLRYRFRLIDAGSDNCPIQISIDNHSLLVISLDSHDIEPVPVDAIVVWPGERVDFVLKADQRPGNYWMRYRGYGRCQVNATSGAFQVAILKYNEVALRQPLGDVAYDIPQIKNTKYRVLNPYNAGTESPQWINVSIPLLNSITPNDASVKKVADQQVYLSFDAYPIDNEDFHRKHLYGYDQVAADRQFGSMQLNHISLKLQQFPLLSQWQMIQPGMLCNYSSIDKSYCTTNHCQCTHVINVKKNSVVELIFVDEGRFGVINHPLHLHGHFFRVVATKNLEGNVTVDRVRQLDREGKIIRRLDRAPIKDTMKAPGGGYSIVRFQANNPGYWFFHCHFEPHMHVGMALVFKVGEHADFPAVPKDFPKCGPFLPEIPLKTYYDNL